MLKSLTLINVALIERAEIEFSEKLNILSGETGAGKSVILDALNFVLGAKADKNMIRRGADFCQVSAFFCLNEEHSAAKTVRDFGLETSGEILILRKFDLSGKGEIKINGQNITVGMLREITPLLVDIHGQSEHFFLLKESNQLLCLDKFAKTFEIKESLSKTTSALKKLYTEKLNLAQKADERERQIDILQFQINEIESANIKDGEEELLLQLRKKISASEKILAAFSAADNILSIDSGALDLVNSVARELMSVERFDDTYQEISNLAQSAATDLSELSSNIKDVLYSFEFDEEELAKCEARLDTLRNIHKKYGASFSDIEKFLEDSKIELDNLTNFEKRQKDLSFQISTLEKEVYTLCIELTNKRKAAAKELATGITAELVQLKMQNAAFEIAFEPYTEENLIKATENGLDKISFLFSANRGEPLKPLSLIISGGEMSRFMLALKAQTLKINDISTFLFDEIDAGISGLTATLVAKKFARIATDTQIIAVSHLPQIAAMSSAHFLIEKTESKDKTVTTVNKLSPLQKTQEIARLLGAAGKSSEKLAAELIEQADIYKKSLNY